MNLSPPCREPGADLLFVAASRRKCLRSAGDWLKRDGPGQDGPQARWVLCPASDNRASVRLFRTTTCEWVIRISSTSTLLNLHSRCLSPSRPPKRCRECKQAAASRLAACHLLLGCTLLMQQLSPSPSYTCTHERSRRCSRERRRAAELFPGPATGQRKTDIARLSKREQSS